MSLHAQLAGRVVSDRAASARRWRRWRRRLVPYLFILPNLLAFAVFVLLPLAWTIDLSLQEGGLLSERRRVGFANYGKALADDHFVQALKNTAIYALMVIPSVMILGLLLAVFIDRVWGKNFFKSALFFPQLSSTVVVAVIFFFMTYPRYGPLNEFVRLLGMKPPNWLGDPDWALPTIVLMELWRGLGFYVVVYLAALAAIPQDIVDAAKIDGAVGVTGFFRVTLPLIRPTLLFTLVMATIWNFQLFDSVYIMTQGGPIYKTATVVWFIYDNAFQFEKVGYAATMALLLLLVILVLTLLQLRFLRSDLEY